MDFHENRAIAEHEAWLCQRLTDWLTGNPRSPADEVFMEGPVRNLAREIEIKISVG